ncbi:hypothetical protein [Nonomuraea gerenzanensis]|nr:hypothetical protein [Nonomuraea gerenzanensis]UBU08777.1 hypothetical protein LCN96_30820 [Nonomuraea gerenzanensis]
MRSTMTAVLERAALVHDELATEPYELPWAQEARFFVQVHELTGRLELRTEISPDGLTWCPADEPPVRVTEPGMTSWLVTGFGQWLRVRCFVSGAGAPAARLRIYVVGKS